MSMLDQYLKPNVKQGALYYAVVAVVLGIIGLIPFLNCLAAPFTFLIWLVLPFAVGWLVAQWGETMPATKTPFVVQSTSPYATPAVDGAVAAGAGALASGVVVWVLRLLSDLFFAGLAGNGAGVLAAVVGGVAGIIAVIIGVVIAAVAGAIGGALYVIVKENRAKTAPPPMNPPAA
ncbi:MAG: hypothetical protein ACM3JD_13080 [Rudaea sp.]